MTLIPRRALSVFTGLILLGGAPAVVRAAPIDQNEPAAAGAIDDTGHHLNVREKNGISYLSGGVGTEERDAMQAMSGRFNLELTIATPSGKYLGDSTLYIDDPQGKTILEVRTDGPLFMAKLPPGEYVIRALTEGRETNRTVSIPSAGMTQVTMGPPEAGAPSRAGDVPSEQHPQREMPLPSDRLPSD